MTPELLKKCMPNATLVNCTFAAPHLKNAMEHYKIDTPERQAAFLAQLAHESGSLKYMSEIASGDAYDTRVDLGNTPEKDGDGRKWKGHGYIQVTGYTNHLAAAKEFGKSIDEIAVWLCTHAGASWSAAWFWSKSGLNTIADKTDMWRGDRGKRKGLDPFTYISVVINGGLNGIEDRRKHHEHCKKALGI